MSGNALYQVTNPATGEVVESFDCHTDQEIQDIITRADAAHNTWGNSSVDSRAQYLNKVADLHEERRDELAQIMTREMGKPLAQAYGEVDLAVAIYRYYADNGPEFLADEIIDSAPGTQTKVISQSLGALLGIMPWNFPLYQVARFAAPNIMNGNTIILKHAPQCPTSALAQEDIFSAAGETEGIYNNVFATNEQCEDIIADPRVHGVSLTGSERAGRAVAETAGRNLKKVVLELGGNDAFILLSTDDMERAIAHAVIVRTVNTGQACNACKRFIIVDDLYDEFVEGFTAAMEEVKAGNPTFEESGMGPLSSQAAADMIASQVDCAIEQGATALVGGSRPNKDAAFYPATVLANVSEDMDVFNQELFGPVATVYRVADEAEAVALANNSDFGLGASVFSTDLEQAERVARALEVGMVFINEAEGTSPELPFGGVKKSGIGRELGRHGMAEFVNRKMIRVRLED